MNLNEYYDFTGTTAIYPDAGTRSFNELNYLTLGLSSEAGEFAGKVSKIIRGDNVNPESLVSEASDVLYFLSRIAGAMNLTLEDLADYSFVKLSNRMKTNTIKGDGDTRGLVIAS